jgi:sulfate adenylyltransferase subunit 1
MDLCNYEERIYEKLKKDFTDKILKHLEFEEVNFVPASALKGDNISFKSDKMPWYKNDSILGILENSGKNHRDSSSNLRFAIQNVYRNQNDMTIVMGRILAGNLTEGEYININSLNNNYKIEKLELKGNKIQNTNTGQSVSLFFRGDTLVNRGDIIFKSNEENIKLSNEIKALICWFSEKPIEKNKNLIIQTILQSSVCYISEIIDKFDINTYEKIKEVKEVITNDICTIKITTENQILEDYYSYNRLSGSLILVDNLTNEIVAGGIII